VATVSLGAPRRFVMRPTEGGDSISLQLGRGDLRHSEGRARRAPNRSDVPPEMGRELPHDGHRALTDLRVITG
jgi:alkylated DNA repair dioxygenase AlkB